MKILLINPSCLVDAGRDLYSAHILGPLFTLQPFRRMTLGVPLALPTLAALTPSHHDVQIVDEEIEAINFDAPVDLVGLTAMTFKATRAYQIAAEFRRRGVKVVMGGIHASMATDEVAQHVDSVVVGEAENLWAPLLADLEAGALKQLYRADAFPPMCQSPVPRYDLVRCRSYLYSYLQTTRGCPFECEFCTVTKMSGRTLRRKTVDQVVAEVDMVLAQSPTRPFKMRDCLTGRTRRFVGMIAFIDDNFAIDRAHAMAVCQALLRYQEEHNVLFFWYTQVNFDVGFDAELVSLMAKSGCRHLFIGFESLDPDVLQGMNKGMNDPAKYGEAIHNIEQSGMRVVYSTIFDDHSNEASVKQMVRFVEEQQVFHVLVNILTPYPGTVLREVMEKDGRILTEDPQQYNIRNVVYRPEGIATVDLEAIYMTLCRQLYRFDRVYARGQNLVAVSDRFVLPLLERLMVWFGVSLTGVLLALQRRLRARSAWRLARTVTKDWLRDGSLAALERQLASCDYEDFLVSEMVRMGKRDGGRRAGLATSLINSALYEKKLPSSTSSYPKKYKAFYVNHEEMDRYGVSVPEAGRGRPVLLLGGTSISLSDRKDFLGHLLRSGFEVAGIENPIGGLFDVRINPVQERPEALYDFLVALKAKGNVQGVDIVAQSYSSFEVARIMSADPQWASFVRSVLLVNPPGLDPHNNVLRHCARFLFGHVLGGYATGLAKMVRLRLSAPDLKFREGKEFSRREVRGISFWTAQTFANPMRTLRELRDITSFRLKKTLRTVIEQGVPLYLFLQAEDQLVPAHVSQAEVRDLIPEQCVTVVPGGHNDLFFQPWQRDNFCHLMHKIRQSHP